MPFGLRGGGALCVAGSGRCGLLGSQVRGAAYLIYLGIKALLDRDGFADSDGTPSIGLKRVFAQAVASNVMNPKIAVFFLAYLPQFASPTAGSVALQVLTLGMTFALLTWLLFSMLGYFSGTLGNWLGNQPSFAGVLRWLAGSVLIGLGLRLALPERR